MSGTVALEEIDQLLKRTMEHAQKILDAIPRREEEPEEAEAETTKIYRTTSRKGLILAHFIDFKKPVSDKTMKSLMAALPSSSSSSSSTGSL